MQCDKEIKGLEVPARRSSRARKRTQDLSEQIVSIVTVKDNNNRAMCLPIVLKVDKNGKLIFQIFQI